jgi:cell division protease FtsH
MTEDPKDEKPEQESRKVGESGAPRPPLRGLILWFLVLATIPMMYKLWSSGQERGKKIGISEFREHVLEQRIDKCEIKVDTAYGKTMIVANTRTFDGGDTDASGTSRVEVDVLPGDKLEAFLDENNIKYNYSYENPVFLQIISGAIPVILILGALYFLFMRQIRSAGHGALSFGKSRAKMLSMDTHKTTFRDVEGIDEAKDEVQEIIEYLKDPKKFQKLGGRIPKGVLLMGPPGTGKTLLAKAIAGEAHVPFFSISGSDFVEMFVGVGASRVRDMFEQGKKNAPCIVFIDEIDAVGRSRFTGIGGGHDEREQTLNALLVEMDGFDTKEGVIIVAATNRPDVLDPALLRPGRFDRQITIDLPTVDGREAILKLHARNIKLSEAANLRRVARGTPGFSGADLANLLNEAALLAAKHDKSAVDFSDLEEARDKVRWGRERRGQVLDEKERRVTAYHEAGHAVVMLSVEESEPVHKVTIIPRGNAYLGATMQLPEKDRYMEGKLKLEGMLVALMGGRVAEELVFGDVTSGAASDLKEASRIARLMVCSWGMSSEMGPQSFGQNEEHMWLGREISRSVEISDDTARRIDKEVSGLLRESHRRATEILTEKRTGLDALFEALLERETLDGLEVEEIVRTGHLPTEEVRAEHERVEMEKFAAADAERAAAKKAMAEPVPDAVTAESSAVDNPVSDA